MSEVKISIVSATVNKMLIIIQVSEVYTRLFPQNMMQDLCRLNWNTTHQSTGVA